MNRSVRRCTWSCWRCCLVGPDVTVLLFALERIGGLASQVADLDARLFHALVDDWDDLLATLLGQRRDVQADDGAVDLRHQPDVALDDRLLDRTQHPAVPGLDHDLVRLGHADAGQLVERRLRAVVVDVDALHEGRRGAAGPDPLEVALHGLDGARHLVLGGGQDLGAHSVALLRRPGRRR